MGLRDTRGEDHGDAHESRVTASAATPAELERRVALDAIAGEVSHELAHTLNFLRVLVDDFSEGEALSAEDRALARKEAQRLARLMGYLRQLKLPSAPMQPVPLREVLLRAMGAAQSALNGPSLHLSAAIEGDLTLLAEPSLLFVLLRDVLTDVMQRCVRSATDGVRVCLQPATHGPNAIACLDITGPTPRKDPATEPDRLAAWGDATTGSGGIGLAVAGRLARLFGWTLEEIQEEDCQGLRLCIPAKAVGVEPGECAS